jgi:hypothetical protein
MSERVTTNFGKIGNQRIVSFDMDAKKDVVVPAGWAARGWDLPDMCEAGEKSKLITPHEAFRRWKIARKAWRSRKSRYQLQLPLSV